MTTSLSAIAVANLAHSLSATAVPNLAPWHPGTLAP
eukprot:CAMPEP_0174712014 /NCGR_PEP_ID=MMETSP1094-20130205/13151_1 /TAXON_ID=156173 /ORGANISM="Chrysochromulina brevifilum, Strain UTEX LB 985" /LENGTH=35 /DNA_ID= /DNA_START= /DNA_END= /DNA_ORIENTATION=